MMLAISESHRPEDEPTSQKNWIDWADAAADRRNGNTFSIRGVPPLASVVKERPV